MENDTVTFGMNGDVSLAAFADSMRQLTSLIQALSVEVSGEAEIEWVVDDLQAGSATATIKGLSQDPEAVERVVEAYAVVGSSLQAQQPIPYSEKVRSPAIGLAKVVDGSNVISIDFETAHRLASVTSSQHADTKAPGPSYSYGMVKGRVETLTRRRGLKFVLYDLVFDRAVYCYLKPGQENQLRDLWGEKVAVIGRIERRPGKRVPASVTNISDIKRLDDPPPGSYRSARGAVPAADDEPPESVIRRMRDA